MRYFALNIQKAFCRSGIIGCRDVSILLVYGLLVCVGTEKKMGNWEPVAGLIIATT